MKKAVFIICLLFAANLGYSQEKITIKKGESKTLSSRGGSGKTVKWYSGSCGGTLVGEGEKIKVTPTETTTYYGRWEAGNKFSDCHSVTIIVTEEKPVPIIQDKEEPVSPINPPINITVNIPTINRGESTTLSYKGENGGVFKWYSGSCGGTPVGEGNNLEVTPTTTTTYYGRWENGDEVSDCRQITVTVKQTGAGRSANHDLDLGYAIWTGKVKNGKPHDSQGTLRFKTQHRIDLRDEKERIANAGDKVIGEFSNGHLVQGIWYKSDGNVESIIIGD